LRAGSNLKGDIRAARLSIEENALLAGKVELTSTERTTASASASVTPPAAASSGALFNAG